jgi:hypothetical protein
MRLFDAYEPRSKDILGLVKHPPGTTIDAKQFNMLAFRENPVHEHPPLYIVNDIVSVLVLMHTAHFTLLAIHLFP